MALECEHECEHTCNFAVIVPLRVRQGRRGSDGEGDCEERDHLDFEFVMVFCWRGVLYVEGEWGEKSGPSLLLY